MITNDHHCMKTPAAYLADLGFTPTETKVYLTGLTRSEMDVRTLVRETGMKRPTIYHALETLMQKGLVAKRGSAQQLVFSMASPERLEQVMKEQMLVLRKRQEEFSEILPLLQKQQINVLSQEVQVVKYEGLSGVKAAIEEALYCKSRKWDLIAPRHNFFSEVDRVYARYYLETRVARGIQTRSLWEQTPEKGERPLTETEVKQRNPRYLPEHLRGRFSAMMILFDEKVLLIHSHVALSAVLIHSAEVHQFMSLLFEGIWAQSKAYLEVQKKKK